MTSFRDHFSRRATQYAAARPSYPVELASYIAGLVAHNDTAWEAGAGSGQLTGILAPHFRRVISTDASFAQLSNAPPLPNVTRHCALAEAGAIADATADLCIAAQAAHWFDLERFYSEVRRVGKPDAIVALVSYGLAHINPPIDAVVHEFHGETLREFWPPERRHVDENYRNLPFPFDEIPTPSFEIRVEWSCDEFIAYVRTWSAVQKLLQSAGSNALDIFAARLRESWGATELRPVRWRVVIRAGRSFGQKQAAARPQ